MVASHNEYCCTSSERRRSIDPLRITQIVFAINMRHVAVGAMEKINRCCSKQM